MYGQDLNPHCYGLMESCADHLHWAGGAWTDSRGGLGAHSEAGGGHAHAGAMIYLGDNWPDSYRNHIFMCNIHGNRINQDILERHGSGYVAHHGKDFLLANDPWFRGLTLLYGPDGGVFVSDWCDTGECHNYATKTETTGRIYKVTYGSPKPVTPDLAALTDEELVKLQTHKNDWWVRHARRLLQERATSGKLSSETRQRLLSMFQNESTAARRLRALWALYCVGAADAQFLTPLLHDKDEAIRVWAIRLLTDDRNVSPEAASKLSELAAREHSPTVRLALASALHRLPLADRCAIAEALAAHAEDAADANLPLMIWYGIEPCVGADPERAAKLLQKAKIPLVRHYIARRIAEGAE
jgi:hypothetical protein